MLWSESGSFVAQLGRKSAHSSFTMSALLPAWRENLQLVFINDITGISRTNKDLSFCADFELSLLDMYRRVEYLARDVKHALRFEFTLP